MASLLSKSNVNTIIITAIGVAIGAVITPFVSRMFAKVPGL